MIVQKVIEPTTTEWGALIEFAFKKDGSHRCCVKHRMLNAVTVRDWYILPSMDECMGSFGEARVFYTLNANSGYW